MLADGIADDLVSDVKRFLSAERREWYQSLGIPYRRGYLLDGPPGSGKSSLVKALACEIGLGLYVLDLTESRLTDTDVAWMLSTLPPRAAVLIEDIDCLELARSRDDEREKAEKKTGDSKVTLSGLLNAIDGVAAAEGRLLFLTSNHPGRVDAAMLRPGRIDRRFYVGPATAGQAERLFRRFFPDSDGLATRFAGLVSARPRETSMAELQELLIQHAEDSRLAVAEAEHKLKEVTP